MIKSNQNSYNWINRFLDLALLYGSYLISVWLWLFMGGHDAGNIAYLYAVEKPMPTLLLFVFFIFVYQYAELYESQRTPRLRAELKRLVLSNALCCAFALGLMFLFKIRDFSRGVAILFFLFSNVLLGGKRIALTATLRTLRARGYNLKTVLVVGSGSLSEKYIRLIRNPQYGFRCIGYVGDAEDAVLGEHLGSYEDLETVLDRCNPDEIIVALEAEETARLRSIVFTCEKQGIRTCIIPYYNDFLPVTANIDTMQDLCLINIRAVPLDIVFNKVIKRLFDIVFSLVVILLLSPVYLLLAIGVKLSSPGPIFFRQTRVGKERRNFEMYKFRSMKVNNTSDTAWSTSRDSRITPFGAFIRKFSLDELPQFFNVLKGDMSVVGPRPELPFFVQQYRESIPRYMIKHQVKPGITGWAQVHGYRGDTSIERRIDYDLWYIENWSFLLDIRIIFMTVFGGMMNEEKNLPWDIKKAEKAEKAKEKEEQTV